MNTTVMQLEAEGFTRDQIEEIVKGEDAGIDVSLYAKKEFLAIQMQQIRLGLMERLPVEAYAKPEYDWFQMEEIRKGLKEGVDISLFASPDISYDRMQQIRLGLRDDIDLSFYKRLNAGILKQMRLAIKNHVNLVPYIIEGYDPEQLEAIREALEKGIDVNPWIKKDYRGIALHEIFVGLENGLDVSAYAKPEYTWQQMKEIRLGIEHMVDIAKYNNVFYSHRQMKEIREGLEEGLEVSYYNSPMYTAKEMHNRRLLLEEASAIILKDNIEISQEIEDDEFFRDDDISQHYNITVSQDEMEAFIDVSGSSEEFDRFGIVKALHDKKICYGILYDVIDDVVNGNSPRKTLLIASGKRPEDGADGWYEFFFRTDFSGIPKELENGNLDYRDVEWYETVEKGQKLAVYHNATKGEEGVTVTGKVIPAKNGREKGLLVGKGFKRLTDGTTYIADAKGIVTLQDNQLNVSELLILKEVNMTTGNVEYDGNILIEGNVSSGSTIKGAKDITVNGFVEDARIICGGSVFLRKGMNGSRGGSIHAEKDVMGYFFEGAEIYAGENIQGDYFFKSQLHTKGLVKAVGKKGVIAGGTVCAEKGIVARNMGNAVGLPTYVKLGSMDSIKKKLEEIEDTIRSVNQELYTLQNVHREFNRKYSPEIRNSMELYLKIESAIYTKEGQMKKLLRDRSGIEEEFRTSSSACATVTDRIYEGVTVEIDGARWKAKDLEGVTIKKSGDRIAIFAK